jgi:hypothetical protein
MENQENQTGNNTNYDSHITPAETAARIENEGDIDTTSGYTVDREGLTNNFAIEPEMYVEEPGDLREEIEADKAERAEELKEINSEDKGGKGKGVGMI